MATEIVNVTSEDKTTDVIPAPDWSRELRADTVWGQLEDPTVTAGRRRRIVRIAFAASEDAPEPLRRALAYLLQQAGCEQSMFGICRLSDSHNVHALLGEPQPRPDLPTLADLADWTDGHPALGSGCAEAMAALLSHSSFAGAAASGMTEEAGASFEDQEPRGG